MRRAQPITVPIIDNGDQTPAGRAIAAANVKRVERGKSPLTAREVQLFYLALSRGIEPKHSAIAKACKVDRATVTDVARGATVATVGTLSALSIGLKVDRTILERIFSLPIEGAEPTDASESGETES